MNKNQKKDVEIATAPLHGKPVYPPLLVLVRCWSSTRTFSNVSISTRSSSMYQPASFQSAQYRNTSALNAIGCNAAYAPSRSVAATAHRI